VPVTLRTWLAKADMEPWVVVNERVAQRTHPSLDGGITGMLSKGQRVEGSVVESDGVKWLKVKDPRGFVFMMIDGASLGFGTLLEKETASSLAIVKPPAGSRVILSVNDAIRLQHSLIRGYMAEDFQRLIWGIYDRFAIGNFEGTKEWVTAQGIACQEVQFPVMERFGFEPSREGVRQSFLAFTPEINDHPTVMANRLLMRYLVNPGMQLDVAAKRLPVPRGVLASRAAQPEPGDWPAHTGRAWLVVGGSEAKGIVVRRGESITSAQCVYRLEAGALVEEVERRDNRLKYMLMDGAGPEIGWVSISHAKKALLIPAFADYERGNPESSEVWKVVHDLVAQRAEPSAHAQIVGAKRQGNWVRGVVLQNRGEQWLEVNSRHGLSFMLIDGESVGLTTLLERVSDEELAEARARMAKPKIKDTLTVEEAVKLQKSLIKGYLSEAFQRLIWEEYERWGSDTEMDLEWVKAQAAACEEVQFPVMERFGFEASREGVRACFKAFTSELRANPTIAENVLLMRYLIDPGEQLKCSTGRVEAPCGVPRTRVQRPHPNDWEPGSGRVWQVVGGGENGGIVVRRQMSTESQTLLFRLATDSVVEQLERYDNRLKYLLMSGSGPEIGWVSICYAGHPLLEPCYADFERPDNATTEAWSVVYSRVALRAEPSIDAQIVGMREHGARVRGVVVEKDGVQWLEASGESGLCFILIHGAPVGLGPLLERVPKTELVAQKKVKTVAIVELSKAEAIRLQECLITGYMSEGFQRKIWQEYFRYGEDPNLMLEWRHAQSHACEDVQLPVIEAFGFEASREGIRACFKAFTPDLKAVPKIAEHRQLMQYLVDPGLQLKVAQGNADVPRGVPCSRARFPNPDEWTEGSGRVWRVVGGEDTGGIVARKTVSLASPELSHKLTTGSLVEELERRDNRLKYELMDGAGPHIGWVSLCSDGKLLLAPGLSHDGAGAAAVPEAWVVVHSRVCQREAPSTKAAVMGLMFQGTKVLGTVVESGGQEWLEVRGRNKHCFMLIDGAECGLGQLLERVQPEEEEDVLALEDGKENSQTQAKPVPSVRQPVQPVIASILVG